MQQKGILIRVYKKLTSNKMVLAGFFGLLLFFIVAALAPWVAPFSFSQTQGDFLKLPPIWLKGGEWPFILGTDDLGRDLLSRLIYGARVSISSAFMAVLLSVFVGAGIGLLAGYLGGMVDRIVGAFVDILLSFPSILLAILVVAILGPGLLNTVIAVNIMAWPAMIRIVRGSTLAEKNKEYVLTVKGFGAGGFRVAIKHILPNVTGPLIAQSILGFSSAILNIAALGFLGLGAQPPLPEWGTMISDGRDLMTNAWWLVTLPGLCILFVVLSFNIVGGALRDILDPRS